MASTLALVAGCALALDLGLRLELPREPPIPGETLFARAHITGLAEGRARASARWQGREVSLHIEEGGVLPIVLAVEIDAQGPGLLRVEVEGADGQSTAVEAEVALAQRVAAPPESWELKEEQSVVGSAEASRAEAASLAAAVALAETPERLSSGNFEAPVTAPRFGRFGAIRSIDGYRDAGEEAPLHRGVDYALRRRASIRPPAPGVVVAIPSLPLLGETVVVSHGQGIASVYGHLESALVLPGDAVTRDSVLGWAGDTGLSNGLMLHYALFVHGVPVDPRSWERLPGWLKDPPAAAQAALPAPVPLAGATSGPTPAATPVQSQLPPPAAATLDPLPATGPIAAVAPAAAATPAAAPAATPPPPMATPVPAATPALPDAIPREQLAELIRIGIEARLPGVKAAIAAPAPGVQQPWNLEIALAELGHMAFATAVEITAFVVGELTTRTTLRTGRLTIVDTASTRRVVLLTRDARQLWRERMGLATPRPASD